MKTSSIHAGWAILFILCNIVWIGVLRYQQEIVESDDYWVQQAVDLRQSFCTTR